MKVLLKIIVAIVLLQVLLLVGLALLPDSVYQKLVVKGISSLTGRQASIGQLSTVRSLHPSIEIKDFKLANPAWSKAQYMIEAQRMNLGISLPALLTGQLMIDTLSFDKPFIFLEKNQQGLSNWQFKGPENSQTNPTQPQSNQAPIRIPNLTRFRLASLKLNAGQLVYTNELAAKQYHVDLPHFNIEQAAGEKQQLSANGSVNKLPFTLMGETGLLSALNTTKNLPFDLTAELGRVALNIDGELRNENKSLLITSGVDAQTQNLADLSAVTGYKLPNFGPITLSADLSSNLYTFFDSGFDIKNLKMNVDDPSVKLSVLGSANGVIVENKGDVKVDIIITDINKVLAIFGIEKSFPGTISLQANAAGAGKDYGLEIEKAIIESDLLNATITGDVANLLTGEGTRVKIHADAPNLGFIDLLFGEKFAKGISMPKQWGPIKASANLIGQAGQYALEDIEAVMSGASSVKATGSIKQLVNFDSMQLDVEAKLANLKQLATLGAKRMPDFGPINATGKLNFQQGVLSLEQAKASYNGQYGQANVSGEIANLIKFDGVNLKTDANVPNLAVAELFSGVALPKTGPISATARLMSPSALDLSLKNLTANYDHDGVKLQATGSIDSLIKSRANLNLNLDAQLKSLADLNKILGLSLPDFRSIKASAKIAGITKDIRINTVKAQMNDSTLEGEVSGDIGKIVNFEGVDIKTNFTTPSVKKLLKQLDIESAINKPGSLSGHIFYSDNSVHIKDSELDISGQKIIGELILLNYLKKDSRPKLSGQIKIPKFDLLSLSDKSAKKIPIPKEPTNGKARVIPSQPLPYDFIRNSDIDVDIDIGLLRDKLFDLSNVKVKLLANDGVLKFGPLNGNVSGGNAQVELNINAKVAPAITSLKTNIEEFKISQTGVFRDTDLIESTGDAFLNVDLTGQGDSLADILASGNGTGFFYFEGLNIKQGALNLFSSDLLKQLIDMLNPFKKKQTDTQITCAAVAFKFEDGVATTPYGLAAEAEDFSITANGKVDFSTEKMDMQFKTKAKKGLGLGFGKLASLVQMKGDLASPSISLNPKGIFEVGATVGAALATGGGSLIAQGFYDKVKANSELCSKALGK